MLRSAAVFLTILSSSPLLAEPCSQEEPWYAYGQTASVPNGSIDNPNVNLNGLRGESRLPFIVPQGRELRLTSYGGEGYNQSDPKGVVYAPFIGDFIDPPNSAFLHSVYAAERSNETTGVLFILPAGKQLNLRIQSSYELKYVVGWYMRGTLCDAPK